MQIVEFHEKLLPSLTRLVNEQIAQVPPGFMLSEAQVARAIAQGGSLWGSHYPEAHPPYKTETLCVLERREVAAAAQWLFPNAANETFSILWLVAHPHYPMPVRTLLHLIDKQAQTHGSSAINFSRFAFGVGWSGLPVNWTHVLHPMLEAGYRETQKWVLMHGETSVYSSAAAPQIDDLRYYWNMNKPAFEWELTAFQGETLAGECQVWGVPPHLADCPGFSEWATVEWIEVAKAYRRQGVGRWLLAEQMRFQSRRGISRFIAWTGQRNRAARKLHESMGFAYGPKLAVMEKP